MVRYLLDTNTASYAIKGNVARVREHLLASHGRPGHFGDHRN